MAETFYQILGVGVGATQDEIKTAYKRLARQHHPDVNQGKAESEEKFKKVLEAYQTLSDQRKKDLYDLKLFYKTINQPSASQPGPHYRNVPKNRREKEREEYTRRRPEREAYRQYTGPPIKQRVTVQSVALTMLVLGTFVMLALWFGDFMNHWTAKDHLSRGDYETALSFDDAYGEAYFARYKDRLRINPNPRILLFDLNLAIRHAETPDYHMYMERGKVFFKLDSLQKCVHDFESAKNLNPRFDTAFFALAELYAYYLKDPAVAIQYYDSTLRLRPGSVDANFGKGFMLYRMRRFASALAQFDRCFALDANDKRVFFYRGSSRLALGDTVGACADLDQSLTMGMEEAKPIVDRFCGGGN